MNKLKIGFFGGCFNPPTIAHVELAKLAIKQANLDKLIFIPMGNCYPKDNLVDIKYRFDMLKIATKNEEKIAISNMQFQQNVINYAIDSFRKIDQEYDAQKYFIMGYDNFIEIENWKSSDELKKYNFIVFERNGKLNNKKNVIFIKTKDFNNISAKQIREKIKNNETVLEYINKDVFEYIQENKLYK